MALVSDPSLEGFNSFVSVDEADAYFQGVYFGSGKKWSEILDVAEKESLLITATRRLNALPWGGFKFDAAQPLAFPRNFREYTSEYGYTVTPHTGVAPAIPGWLKSATYDMALWIWSEEDRPATDAEFAMLKSMKVGPLDYTFRDGALSLPPSVTTLLSGLGSTIIDFGSGPKTLRMVL